MGLLEETLISSIKDENLNPKITKSKNFKHWISIPDDRRCYDINYTFGKMNSQRIIWSNDGLVFVTYDHYHTFYEII